MDLSKLGRTEQVLVSAGLLLFVFSFLPWFEVTDGVVSAHADAWSWPSGFNDWFPIVLLFLYAIVLALPAFGVLVPVPLLARPTNRAFIGLVLSAFAVLMFAIQGLTYPGSSFYSSGPAWAYYVSLVIALAAGAQSYLGFTQQGGSFAQVGAAFQARTQAVGQQNPQQPPYQPPYQQPPYGAPQNPASPPPYAQPPAPPQQAQPQPPQAPQQPPQPPYGA